MVMEKGGGIETANWVQLKGPVAHQGAAKTSAVHTAVPAVLYRATFLASSENFIFHKKSAISTNA